MNFAKLAKISLICLLTVVLAGCGEASVNLKLDWEEGDSFRYVQTTDQEIHQTIQGREQKIEQKQIMTFRYDVEGSTGPNRIVRVTTERIQQDQQMPGRRLRFDSDQPEDSQHPAAGPLSNLVGQSYEMVLNPEGQVEDIRGLETIYDEIAGDNARKARMLKQMFGEETLKQMVDQMFQVHRDQPRTVGEEWNHTFEMSRPMPMVMTLDYRLDSISGDDVNVKVDSTIKPNEDVAPLRVNGREMTYSLEGKQSGKLVFSRSNHYIKKQELDQQFEGTMEMDMGGMMGTQQIPLTIEGVYKLEGEKL